jgi:2-dehydro-3-deoxyphosphooctonate aldolase (KDO 8-P synthase)
MLCERGTTFGYHNLVVDFRGLAIMQSMGYPVVFDATHSVQLPGGGAGQSSGQRQFAPVLARAALTVGIAAIFAETHPRPEEALSDGANSIRLSELSAFIAEWVAVDRMVKENFSMQYETEVSA